MSVETATSAPEATMQDISNRVEDQLFGSSEAELEQGQTDDVALDDEETLPEGDDTDSDDTDSSEDLEAIASEEELSLAAYLGLDDDRLIVGDDGSVLFNAIIDGESKEVPLSDLATSYQLQGHVNNKSIALENERKEFETQRDTIATDLSTRIGQVQQMTKIVEDQLVGDFNKIDWDRLRAENPSEWSALRQEFAEKAQKVQQLQSSISTQQQQLDQQKQQEAQQKHQQYLQGEMQKMIASNPTWSDPQVMQAETGKLKSFLSEAYGLGEAEFAYVTDHRLIGLIQDAQAYRQGKKGAEVKITKKVPKFQKPGAAKGNAKSLAKARSVKASKSKLKNSGSIDDAANVLLSRM